MTINALLPLLSIVILLSGCSHALTIKNRSDYFVESITANPTTKPITVAVKQKADYDFNHDTFYKEIANALNSQTALPVPYPYLPQQYNGTVDIVATIDMQSDYKGSGYNFLITWPGFLVWAPAWNGYVYEASHNIHVALINNHTQQPIKQFDIPIVLNIRHADMSRTAWAEAGGWLAPGWSAVALVSGVVFIQYDNDLTPQLTMSTKELIGRYVAQEIMKQLQD